MSSEIKNSEIPQNPAAKKAGPGKPGNHKKPGPKPDKPKPRLHPLRSYTGLVGGFGANPEGVYDRFTLTVDDHAYTVKFPPHFGEALRAVARPGGSVAVLGFVHTTPKGDEHLHLARLDADGQSLRPLPPVPAPAPTAADFLEVQGPVAEVLRDPQGRPCGLRLAGEAPELRFPPHLGEPLAGHLAVGAVVQASGPRRPARPGEVRAAKSQPPMQVEILTVGGEAFLVR